MTPSASTNLYKHHPWPAEIISYAVWLYCRFCLGHRDVEKLRFVRSVIVSYEAMLNDVGSLGICTAGDRPG
jgi:transposase-like protein